jgi:hypothetical protein
MKEAPAFEQDFPGSWNPQRTGELGCMDVREELLRQLHTVEELLALSAETIRRQDSRIRCLEFGGHFDVAETARRLRQRFVQTHALYVVRRYKLLIQLARSNKEEGRNPPAS